jgi:hypothetical protein
LTSNHIDNPCTADFVRGHQPRYYRSSKVLAAT